MRSFRSLLGAGRKVIVARLDHLRSTLQHLGERLRATVVQTISENLGCLVRETFLETLEVDAPASRARHPPMRHAYSHQHQWQDSGDYYWGQPDQNDGWREEYDPRYESDYEREMSEPRESPPAEQELPGRFPVALASGLRAVAWSLRRWTGKCSYWAIAGIGVVVACAAYFTGSLTMVGLSLLESADQLATIR